MLTGRHCSLKILEEPDWRTAYEVFAQPHVWRWIAADPARVIPSEFASVLMGHSAPENCRLFGIWTDRLIGFCGFREIDWQSRSATITAYACNEPAKGLPVVTLGAMRLLLQHGFHDMGLNRIEAQVLTGNKPVLAILERLGLRQEGVLRQKWWAVGAYHDLWICAMLRTEYIATIGSRHGTDRHPVSRVGEVQAPAAPAS